METNENEEREKLEDRIKTASANLDPSEKKEDLVIVEKDKITSYSGRPGGKSEICRIKDSNQERHNHSVKIYIQSKKTITGKNVAKSNYAMEKSVLKAIPHDPPTYLKGLHYDDEGLFIIFPRIHNFTLEEKIKTQNPNLLLTFEEVIRKLKTSRRILTQYQSEIEKNLVETVKAIGTPEDNLRTTIPSPTEQDYINDLRRYNQLFKDILGEKILFKNDIDYTVKGLTNPNYKGICSPDTYLFHFIDDHMLDAGIIENCSIGIPLACSLGHHTVIDKFNHLKLNHLLMNYLEKPGLETDELLHKSLDFSKKVFIPSCVYTNARELAGVLKSKKIGRSSQKDIKSYVKQGINCLAYQVSKLAGGS